MELNIDEALRYLGVKSDPDGVLHAQMIPLAAALQRRNGSFEQLRRYHQQKTDALWYQSGRYFR